MARASSWTRGTDGVGARRVGVASATDGGRRDVLAPSAVLGVAESEEEEDGFRVFA